MKHIRTHKRRLDRLDTDQTNRAAKENQNWASFSDSHRCSGSCCCITVHDCCSGSFAAWTTYCNFVSHTPRPALNQWLNSSETFTQRPYRSAKITHSTYTRNNLKICRKESTSHQFLLIAQFRFLPLPLVSQNWYIQLPKIVFPVLEYPNVAQNKFKIIFPQITIHTHPCTKMKPHFRNTNSYAYLSLHAPTSRWESPFKSQIETETPHARDGAVVTRMELKVEKENSLMLSSFRSFETIWFKGIHVTITASLLT